MYICSTGSTQEDPSLYTWKTVDGTKESNQTNKKLTEFFRNNPFSFRQIGTLAKSEDPDEMLLNAAFHQGLHCLLT